jgi:hypothetical protein
MSYAWTANQRSRRAAVILDVFLSSLKQPKEKFSLVVKWVMATSRKYSTELMVQKGLLK